MAENTTAVTEQEEEYQYAIQVEDAGPATKKVTVEIPAERISEVLDLQYKELRQQAAIPGFRPGHAPQKLIEKRFSSEIREQVRRTLVSESYEQAVRKHNLSVIGEPQFENAAAIEIKPDQALSYSFHIEVQPEFTIPDFSGLTVKKARVAITEDNVNQAMQNLREQQGTLVPVEDRGVEDKDYLEADVRILLDGKEVGSQQRATMVSRPGKIAGIDVVDLDRQLAGLKPGEKRTIQVKVPDTHPQEPLRGKDVTIEIHLSSIRRLELREINDEFLAELGFENEKELRDALREQMEERVAFDIQQSMREQVHRFLLENTAVELPSRMSDRQAERVVSRRAVDLLMRGVPREQIDANVERLRAGAKEEAARELKLFFILQKIANDENVDVDESELNGRIAMAAAQNGQRPEKLKQQMAKDGSLQNLYLQLREQKAVDALLKRIKVEEVDLSPGDAASKKDSSADT